MKEKQWGSWKEANIHILIHRIFVTSLFCRKMSISSTCMLGMSTGSGSVKVTCAPPTSLAHFQAD